MSIILHKEHGVNPHLTYCPRCSGETQELILSGNSAKYECEHCHVIHLGRPKFGKCERCGSTSFKNLGVPDPSEKFPASDVCDNCKKELGELRAEIDLGGLPFRCKDCHTEGVIKHDHPFAIAFRKEHPVGGVEFSKGDVSGLSTGRKNY